MALRPTWKVLATAALLAAAVLVDASARPGRWTLDFACEAFDRVLIPQPVGPSERHWYCLYSVSNPSGMDRELTLRLMVQAETSAGRCLEHWDVADPTVQKAVQAHRGRNYLDAVQMQGRLRVDERKDGIAVFGPLSPETDRIRLHVLGLSAPVILERKPADFERLGREGREVLLLTRGPDGACSLVSPFRHLDGVAYDRLSPDEKAKAWPGPDAGGSPSWRMLDTARLPGDAAAHYQERQALRRTYARRGDEVRAQLDVYRLESEDWVLVAEPAQGPCPQCPPRP